MSGLAEEGSNNGLLGAVAARFADADARRMKLLDDAVKRGLDHVEGDEPMPRVTKGSGRVQGCGKCGGEGHNARSCQAKKLADAGAEGRAPRVQVRTAKLVAKEQRPAEPKVTPLRPRRAQAGGDLLAMSVDDLVELGAQVKAELRRRQEDLAEQLEAVKRAVGGAA